MLNNVVCVTFSGTDIHRRLQIEFNNLYKDNFYTNILYTLDSIKNTKFYNDNLDLFKYRKYSGYFLWKPYIILEALNSFPNKLILYIDSNLRFKNFSGLAKYLDSDYFLIGHKNFINKHWTKRDTFILMDSDEEKYWEAHQIWTTILGFNSSKKEFLEEYLHYCQDERIVTELPNTQGKENFEGFTAHRWEQSVMSILVEKYNLNFHWDYDFIPHTMYKTYPEDLLKQKEEENSEFIRFL